DADEVALEAVGLLQGIDAGAVLAGDGGQRLAPGDLVAPPRHALVGRQRGEPGAERRRPLHGDEQRVRAVRVRGPLVEAGIERVQLVDVDAGKAGGRGEIDLPVELHDLEV